jgi:hypothetical protein
VVCEIVFRCTEIGIRGYVCMGLRLYGCTGVRVYMCMGVWVYVRYVSDGRVDQWVNGCTGALRCMECIGV